MYYKSKPLKTCILLETCKLRVKFLLLSNSHLYILYIIPSHNTLLFLSRTHTHTIYRSHFTLFWHFSLINTCIPTLNTPFSTKTQKNTKKYHTRTQKRPFKPTFRQFLRLKKLPPPPYPPSPPPPSIRPNLIM